MAMRTTADSGHAVRLARREPHRARQRAPAARATRRPRRNGHGDGPTPSPPAENGCAHAVRWTRSAGRGSSATPPRRSAPTSIRSRSRASRSSRSTPPRTWPGMDLARDLGFPGEYPYTRGVHATMYRGRMFTMRQFAGFGRAAASRTSATTTCSRTGRPGSRSPSTTRRSWATTPTTRSRTARSASAASRSTACATWRSCSTASIRARSRPR